MTTLTITDYLKYANLQLATEVFLKVSFRNWARSAMGTKPT